MYGKIYKRLVKYAVQSKYIDCFICFSKNECKYYAETFDVKEEKFKFCYLGVEDINNNISKNKKSNDEKTILSCGRSNRDYEFLYEALKNTEYKLEILSDECKLESCENIYINNNTFGDEYLRKLSDSYIVVIPLKDENISSGQLVALQSMQLGKPIICTESNTIKDYIIDGENGFIIKKNKDILIKKLEELYKNKNLYEEISENEKRFFKKNCSIESLGSQIGTIYNNLISK